MKEASRFTKLLFKIFPPKHVVRVDGIKKFTFGDRNPSRYIGSVVDAPMESGKRALFRCYEVRTPSDPGDMSFIRWEFVKYI